MQKTGETGAAGVRTKQPPNASGDSEKKGAQEKNQTHLSMSRVVNYSEDPGMPDEFPTLEAIAALTTLAVLVRALQEGAALSEIRRLSGEIAEALRAGDRRAARRICAQSEGVAFASLASALLEALGTGPVDRESIVHEVEHAAARVVKRSRRASASGVLVGLLLVGMLFYAVISRISPDARAVPSTLFDVLVVLGVLVLAVGIVLNQRVSTETRKAARRMLEAATTDARSST
jgi:hypothetical protein